MKSSLLFTFCALAFVVFSSQAHGQSQSISDYGDVVNVTPRIETVITQRRVCGSPQQYQNQNQQSDNNVGRKLLGAIAGGIIGNQVGGGNGKTIATALGAVAGSEMADTRSDNNGYANSSSQCYYENVREPRQNGFNVTYIYQGRQMQTVTYQDPGSKIRLNITITPAGSGW